MTMDRHIEPEAVTSLDGLAWSGLVWPGTGRFGSKVDDVCFGFVLVND